MRDRPLKVSVFMALSLDGFIARPDGDVAWLEEGMPLPEGDDAGYADFFKTVDVLVMGRGSFEKVLAFDPWPYGDKPVIVMSKSLTEIPENLSHSVTLYEGGIHSLLENLPEIYSHIYLDGGQLVQSFLREGLIDEMTLTTIPILIGKGIPLFGHLDHDIHLKHLSSRYWDNGFVQTVYQVLS
ncbi:dihydrofolate reductase family protein [Anaerolineales bacterium]